MRISDWSSDVCSSDLAGRTYAAVSAVEQVGHELGFAIQSCHAQSSSISTEAAIDNALKCYQQLADNNVAAVYVTTHRGVTLTDRKSVVEGKSGSALVTVGGRRHIKQNNKENHI